MNREITASIIIPIYNEEKVLSHALMGISWLPKKQVIFVDGGSTDASATIIRQAGYVCLQSAPGRALQMNHGAYLCKSDILVFLHIDTSFNSSNLLNIKKAYIQGYLSGRFDISLSNNSLRFRIISFFINIRSRLTRISTGDQVIFVRNDVFRLLHGYPDIALMEDVALSARLRRLGTVACLSDKVITSSRRWEAHGAFRVILLMWKIRFLFWLGVSPEKLNRMYRGG